MLSKFEGVGIKAISACVPETALQLVEYAPNLITVKEVKRFVKSTGFSKLRISGEGVTTSDLCYTAACNLFAKTDVKPGDIDGLIFVTQTPDWYLPATSHYLQDRLGFSQDIVCFDVNEGCSGYEAGLYLAATLVASGQCGNVLLLAGDTISKITNPEDRATRLIFGDAGTASVIAKTPNAMSFSINTYGDRYEAIMTAGSRHRVTPPSSVNKGFLSLDGLGIMNFTLNDVPVNMMKLMDFAGVNDSDIALYACHQANKLILNSLADKLSVARGKLPFAAGETGNTSSASIPLLLCQEQFSGLGKVLLCGFGVGLACASCLTDLTSTKILDVVLYE